MDLKRDFGSLLKKLLFLGRTLLLWLWVLGTHFRKRLGQRGEQPEQLGASKPVLVQECWLQGKRTCGGAPFGARRFAGPFRDLKGDFGSVLKKLLFLGRTLLLRLWVLGRHVQKRLGSLARRGLLGWLVGWLVGWLDGWLVGKLVSL